MEWNDKFFHNTYGYENDEKGRTKVLGDDFAKRMFNVDGLQQVRWQCMWGRGGCSSGDGGRKGTSVSCKLSSPCFHPGQQVQGHGWCGRAVPQSPEPILCLNAPYSPLSSPSHITQPPSPALRQAKASLWTSKATMICFT